MGFFFIFCSFWGGSAASAVVAARFKSAACSGRASFGIGQRRRSLYGVYVNVAIILTNSPRLRPRPRAHLNYTCCLFFCLFFGSLSKSRIFVQKSFGVSVRSLFSVAAKMAAISNGKGGGGGDAKAQEQVEKELEANPKNVVSGKKRESPRTVNGMHTRRAS